MLPCTHWCIHAMAWVRLEDHVLRGDSQDRPELTARRGRGHCMSYQQGEAERGSEGQL